MNEADSIARQIQTAKEIGALQEGQRNLQRADELHEAHMQRLETQVAGVRSAVEEKIESLRAEMQGLVASSAMNAAELVLSRYREMRKEEVVQKPLPVREFIQERPYTSVGISGVVVAILNWMVPILSASPHP